MRGVVIGRSWFGDACGGVVWLGELGSEGGSAEGLGTTPLQIRSPGCGELKLEDMVGVARKNVGTGGFSG